MSQFGSIFPGNEDYSPAGETSFGQTCTCDCHRFPRGTVMHVIACCSPFRWEPDPLEILRQDEQPKSDE